MIKLITQFDNEKTRLSLATPTCGGCCCCCCCCIVSTFAAASISARNFGNYVEEKLPNEPQKIKYARRTGFWLPIGLLIVLGIGFLFADIMQFNIFIVRIAFGIIYLFNMTFLLNGKLNISGIISRVIGFSVLLGIFEGIGFFVGLYALLYLGWFYLIGAIICSVIFICWAFAKDYDNIEKLKNNDGNETCSNDKVNEDINDMKNIENTSDLTNDLEKEKISSTVQIEKKKCPNCGTENALDNKRCIYCANYFETDDEK